MMATQQHLDGLANNPGLQPDHTGQYQPMPQDPNMHGMPGAEVQMDGGDDHQNPKVDPPKDGAPKSKDKRERLRSRACVACHTGKTRCSDTLPCQSCIKRGISNSCAYPDPLDNAHTNSTGGGADGNPSTPSTSRRKSNQQQTPQQAGQSVFSTGPHVRAFYYDNQSVGGAQQQQQQQPQGVQAYPNGAASVIGPAAAIAASNAAMVRRDDSPSGTGRPTKKARYRNLTETELSSFQNPTPQQLAMGASSSKMGFKRGAFYIGDSAPVTVDHRLPLRILLNDEQNVDFFIGAATSIDGLPP